MDMYTFKRFDRLNKFLIKELEQNFYILENKYLSEFMIAILEKHPDIHLILKPYKHKYYFRFAATISVYDVRNYETCYSGIDGNASMAVAYAYAKFRGFDVDKDDG